MVCLLGVWNLIYGDYLETFLVTIIEILQKMSHGALILKFAVDGNKIRVISDVNNNEYVTCIK